MKKIKTDVEELLGKMTKEEEPLEGQVMIEGTEAQEEAPEIGKPPKGYYVNPVYIERKSARIQLVLKPSTEKALKAYCKKHKVSVNTFVGDLIENALKEK